MQRALSTFTLPALHPYTFHFLLYLVHISYHFVPIAGWKSENDFSSKAFDRNSSGRQKQPIISTTNAGLSQLKAFLENENSSGNK